MTWFHKPKSQPIARPQRCQRCQQRVPTQQIRMLWRAADEQSVSEDKDWWLCAECATELRRGEPPTS